MDKNLTMARNRALRYWFIDGLAEMAAGLVSLFMAVLFWIWPVIFLWRWSMAALFGTALAAAVGLRMIIQRIKVSSTYQRSGYAAPLSGLESKGSVLSVVIFTLCLLAANVFFSTSGPQAWFWSPALAGLVFAFIFAWSGTVMKLRRFYPLAVISTCAGLLAAVLGMDYFRGIAMLAAIVGGLLLLQGWRVRKAYLQNNPLPGRLVDE
jgi:hypothetical protein